jgi:RNA polymerase sigma factor (sigma-70 family)
MITSQFIQSCQSGDERSIQTLVQTYQRAVFQLALSIIDDGEPLETRPGDLGDLDSSIRTAEAAASAEAVSEAEVATRETFVTAIDRMGRYREDSSFDTWLFGIAIQVSRRRAMHWKLRRATMGLLRRTWQKVARRSTVKNHLSGSVQPASSAVADREGAASLMPGAILLGDKTRLHPGDADMWASVRRLDEKLRIPVVLRYYHDYPINEIAHLMHISEGVVHARLDSAREKITLQFDK